MEATVYLPAFLMVAMGVAFVVAYLTINVNKNKDAQLLPDNPSAEMTPTATPAPTDDNADEEKIEVLSPETPVLLTAKAGHNRPKSPPRIATYLYPRRDRIGWGCFRSSSGQRFSARLSDIVEKAA